MVSINKIQDSDTRIALVRGVLTQIASRLKKKSPDFSLDKMKPILTSWYESFRAIDEDYNHLIQDFAAWAILNIESEKFLTSKNIVAYWDEYYNGYLNQELEMPKVQVEIVTNGPSSKPTDVPIKGQTIEGREAMEKWLSCSCDVCSCRLAKYFKVRMAIMFHFDEEFVNSGEPTCDPDEVFLHPAEVEDWNKKAMYDQVVKYRKERHIEEI